MNGPWHKWFAWYPVKTCEYGWKWLQFVERSRVSSYEADDFWPDGRTETVPAHWEYRPVQREKE